MRDKEVTPTWLVRARRYLPAGGSPYELFDYCGLVLGLSLIGYVFNDPLAAVSEALTAPLAVFPAAVWGLILTAASLFGMCCAYGSPRWLLRGHVLMAAVCSFWALCFLIGIIGYGAPGRNFSSVLIYLFVARGVARRGQVKE